MKILMISTDRSILEPESAARARMIEYGRFVEELHIVVFSTKGQIGKIQLHDFPSKISDTVWAYPTGSSNKWLRIIDAVRLGRRILHAAITDPPFLITCQDPFETGCVGAYLGHRFRVPLQIQIHTDFLSLYFARQSILNRVRVLLARFTLQRADCVRVVSERIRRGLLTAKSYKLKAQPVVLPIFVDAARFSARPDEKAVQAIRTRYAEFDRLILMVGRLTPEKNIALAIEAMREVVKTHPRTGLIILGSGSGKTQLVRKAKSYKLTAHAVFEPSATDVVPYYHAADIFLHTSNYEGYGMVLIEAAAAGLPIVATDVGIAGEVLYDGDHALVCQIGDSVCIRERLLRLLGDEALRARLGRAAQEAALRHAVSKEEYLKRYKEGWERCTGES